MSWKLTPQQLFMYHPDLANIADPVLPTGYEEVPNTAERLPSWVSLLNTVFGRYSVAELTCGPDALLNRPAWSDERVKLVACDDTPVALGMAWHEPTLWPNSGFVFWVAVSPEHHRRGLGLFVLARVLNHSRRDGLRDAVLYTEEFRHPAVRLYLRAGFVPMVTATTPNELERWRRTLHELGEPQLVDSIRTDYDHVTRRIGN